MRVARSLAVAVLSLALALGAAVPASAGQAVLPGDQPQPYQRWSYPSQLPTGPIEDGTTPARPTSSGFLTLPFLGPHYVTSIFDHCNPNYTKDGIVCRWDGKVHVAGGMTDDDTTGQDWLYYDGHDGMDYGLYYEPVAASADGVVSFEGWDVPGNPKGGFGQNVFIDHGNGLQTRYAHLSQIWVTKGQAVKRGEVIGISGNTGASTGEHLHWGVYKVTAAGRVPVDPYGWSGSQSDPYSEDIGNLWLGGAPRFPDVVTPAVDVQAQASAAQVDLIDVSWGNAGGGKFDVQVVDGTQARPWLSGVSAGSASFQGVPGHSYWFLVTVHDGLGRSADGSSGTVLCEDLGLQP